MSKIKWKTPITLLKKSLVDSYSYVHKLTAGNFKGHLHHPYIDSDRNNIFSDKHISIFKIAYEMVADFNVVSDKLKELSDNGDIFRLHNDDRLSVQGEGLPSELIVPCYQVTRKHLDMLIYGGFRIKDPVAICHAAVRGFIKEFKKLGIDISEMKVRAHGKSLYSKAVCSSLIYSIDLGDSSTSESNIKAWYQILNSYISELAIRPVHITFDGETLEDFSQHHFVIYEDRDFCWNEDILPLKSCSDLAYRMFLFDRLEKDGFNLLAISNEISALNLKIKADPWIRLPFISSKKLIANSGLMPLYLELEEKESDNKQEFDKSLMISYLFESGFLSLNSESPCNFLYIGNFDIDVYSSGKFELHGEHVSNTSYLKSCRLSKLIEKNVQSFDSNKKKAIKREKKSDDRYVAIYAVHTEPLTLIGFAKCTSKSRHLLNNFKYSCRRYTINSELDRRREVEIPMVVLDCNDNEIKFIESIIDKHPSKSKKIFVVNEKGYYPINGKYYGKNHIGNSLFEPLPVSLFNVSGIDLCCVNYSWLIHPNGDLLDYYTPAEMKIIESRSFERDGNSYNMLLSLAMRAKEGCVISLIWKFDEFSRGMNLDLLSDDVFRLSANFSKASPFTIDFHPNKISVAVDGNEIITMSTSYKSRHGNEGDLFFCLLDLVEKFRNVILCKDDELPEATGKLVNKFIERWK
jgi:hypothetical protein